VSEFARKNEERLIILLTQEAELLGKFFEESLAQEELLREDKAEEFIKSLERGGKLIEKVNELHQETHLLMQSYVSFSETENRKIDAVETAKDKLRDAMQKASELNEKNTAVALEKQKEFSQKISKVNQNRKSIGLYAQVSGTNRSELFDKKT